MVQQSGSESEVAIDQPQKLGGLLWGQRASESWHASNEATDFFDLKGIVDSLCEWAGHKAVTYESVDSRILHPGQSAVLKIDGQDAGVLGRLHPEIEAKLELDGVFVFELDAHLVLARPRRQYAGISKFPTVRRDLAVVIPRSVNAADIEERARKAAGEYLVEFRLFDVYEGKGIDSNEKSLAIGLTYQSQTATLTDDEVATSAGAVMAALTDAFGARQR